MLEGAAETVTTPGGGPSADVLLLHHCLEKLRTRQGLTLDRLRATRESDARPLFELSAVRRLSAASGGDAAEAVLQITRYCAASQLSGTDRIIADVVLGLGTLRQQFEASGLAPRALSRLYAAGLGTRREALLFQWVGLHRAIGSESPPTPSDRVLRGHLETAALGFLAAQLWRVNSTPVPSILSATAVRSSADEPPDAHPDAGGRVLVLGGAVVDITFRTRAIPAPQTSEEASESDLLPGGKGLTQAVAAARLGLRVSLVAAIGDDYFGDLILRFLESENVDTSYVRRVPGEQTPRTGVIALPSGESRALIWRNEMAVRLSKADVDALSEDIADFDIVMATYEPPIDVVRHFLAQVLGSVEQRPLTLLTPAPPYIDQSIGGQALGHVDYLIAHRWELNTLMPDLSEHQDLHSVALRVLQYGPGTLCTPVDGACFVYSHTLGLDPLEVPGFPSLYKDAAGARDALCGALALRLFESRGQFSGEIASWATAAMATATYDRGVPQSMPRREQIEATLERQRFVVTARDD